MYNNRLLEFLGAKNNLCVSCEGYEILARSGLGPDLVRTKNLWHLLIFSTSLTLDLEGVEFNPGNLVYLYYFVADSDIHIECGSTDIFSADNPTCRNIGQHVLLRPPKDFTNG